MVQDANSRRPKRRSRSREWLARCGRPLNLEEAGRFHLAGRRIAVEAPLRLTWGGTSLRVGAPESSGPGIAVTLDGPVADVVTLAADRLPADLSAEGGIRADFRLNTSIDDLQPAGALDF